MRRMLLTKLTKSESERSSAHNRMSASSSGQQSSPVNGVKCENMLKSEINTWGCVCVGGRVKLSNARPEDLLWSAPLHNCARTSGKNSSIVVIVDTGVPAPSSQGWKGILWAFTPNVWGGILLFFFFLQGSHCHNLGYRKNDTRVGVVFLCSAFGRLCCN